MELEIPGLKARSPSAYQRMSMMLWGNSGCGKTTLAATMPGHKLWLLFDPDGDAAVSDRDDVSVFDFSDKPASMVERFKQENCAGIEKVLTDNPDITTVVVDSVTSFGELALEHGVVHALQHRPKEKPSIEDPGFAGYGRKNTWTRYMVMNLARLTARLDRHIIFIAHEDMPQKDKEGNVVAISIMLGSSLNEQVPIKLSEIWWMQDTGKERRLAIRPVRSRRPMKSRMFVTDDKPEFVCDYDAMTGEGDNLGTYYELWQKNGYSKLPLPGTKEYESIKG